MIPSNSEAKRAMRVEQSQSITINHKDMNDLIALRTAYSAQLEMGEEDYNQLMGTLTRLEKRITRAAQRQQRARKNGDK